MTIMNASEEERREWLTLFAPSSVDVPISILEDLYPEVVTFGPLANRLAAPVEKFRAFLYSTLDALESYNYFEGTAGNPQFSVLPFTSSYIHDAYLVMDSFIEENWGSWTDGPHRTSSDITSAEGFIFEVDELDEVEYLMEVIVRSEVSIHFGIQKPPFSPDIEALREFFFTEDFDERQRKFAEYMESLDTISLLLGD